jgi:membrane-associated protein
MFFNLIGALAWVLSLTGIGYFLVQLFPQITDYMAYIFVALIVLTAIPIFRIIFRNRKKKE